MSLTDRRKVVSDPLPWVVKLDDEARAELEKKDRAKQRRREEDNQGEE